MSQQQPNEPVSATILNTTKRVGSEVVKARRDLAETQGTVAAIYDLIAPSGDGEGENPVLEALEQVLLALRHQSMTIEEISLRLDRIEKRLPGRA